MLHNRFEEQGATLIELDAIVAAHDIIATYKGVDEILLARLIDSAICLTTKFDHIEKKYHRHQANDFFLPAPYYFVKQELDKFFCKKIMIPSPYFLSSHYSSELYFNFSGIVFDAREVAEFFSGEFFKSYQDNQEFYSLLLRKIQNYKTKSEEEILTIEIMQELRMLRSLVETMKHYYLAKKLELQRAFDAEFEANQLRKELEDFKNSPKKFKATWSNSITHVVRYAYSLGHEGKKASSKDDTRDYLRNEEKLEVVTGVLEAFWKGLPDSAKKYNYNTPKNIIKKQK